MHLARIHLQPISMVHKLNSNKHINFNGAFLEKSHLHIFASLFTCLLCSTSNFSLLSTFAMKPVISATATDFWFKVANSAPASHLALSTDIYWQINLPSNIQKARLTFQASKQALSSKCYGYPP